VAASTIVGLAQANSIPLMSYDRLVLNSPVEFYLSFDNIEVGRIQGRYLWDNVGPGNYIILQGSPSDNNASLFYAGAMEVLGPKRDAGDLNILQTVTISDWTPREAFLITQRMLQEHSKIDAVLAPNDGTAAGVIHAIQQLPTAPEITVTGQDAEIRAAQRILEGKQSMTIFKDTRKLAGEAIRIALERLKSGRWPPTDREISNGMTIVPSHFLQPVLVTQDNLQEVLIDSGYIDQEDIMGQP
jgi:D-xylose transport system substrate-binding protein